MFHSSSFRHEQYRVRSANSSKHTLHKKLPSLDSKISAVDTDSECSSSSSPSYSSVSSPASTTSFTASSTAPSIATLEQVVKKPTSSSPTRKKKRTQTAHRQPDLVYSCPRPLAFPFHNDDHFLPIAEADPRDVARVSPASVHRAQSIQSGRDTESHFSRHSSILSSIQQGTVSTIRSLFQIPNAISQSLTPEPTHPYQPLERIEIKQGTVQSLKDFFTAKPSSSTPPKTARQLESQPSQPQPSPTLMQRASRVLFGSPPVAVHNEPPKKSLAAEIKKFSTRIMHTFLPTTTSPSPDTPIKETPSKVGQLWHSFKSFWSNPTSKVGPIAI
ncbi:hypothetical protein BY458DRAFT_527048 [Sporodiniella umbellata]|nr:hypothetical protein BY458DRAFT_527048 [Sporodiniella umbellata]